jgi:mono/diheme cytochrome c family protein
MKKGIITLGLLVLVVIIVQSQTGDVKTKASINRGKLVYNKYCLTCHQADGGGVPRMNPPLIKTEYVALDKERLIGIVLKGFNQPIEINGEEYSNVMASHAFLTDLEVADVLTYVRNSFGNKYAAITPAEVKSVRSKK